MMYKDSLVFDYDAEADVMYITDPSRDPKDHESVVIMGDYLAAEGLTVRWNEKTRKAVGLTVFDFMKRNRNGEGLPVPHLRMEHV